MVRPAGSGRRCRSWWVARCSDVPSSTPPPSTPLRRSWRRGIRDPTLTHDLGEIEVYFEPHGLARPRRRLGDRRGRESDRTSSVSAIASCSWNQGSSGSVPTTGPCSRRWTPVRSAVATWWSSPITTPRRGAHARRRAPRSARFVGVMGSRRHVGHHVEALRSMGVTDDEITRVRSPLGLDLGGRGPVRSRCRLQPGSSPTRTVGTEGGSTAEMGSAPAATATFAPLPPCSSRPSASSRRRRFPARRSRGR